MNAFNIGECRRKIVRIVLFLSIMIIAFAIINVRFSTVASASEIDLSEYDESRYNISRTSNEIIIKEKYSKTADTCSDLGSNYKKTDTINKGSYIGKTGSYKKSKRYDFTNGDYFYDFKYGWKFWSKNDDYHKKYKKYDECRYEVSMPRYMSFNDGDIIKWKQSDISSYGFWSSNAVSGQGRIRHMQYYISAEKYVDLLADYLEQMDREFELSSMSAIALVLSETGIGGLKLYLSSLGITLTNPYFAAAAMILLLTDVRDKIANGIASDTINDSVDIINEARKVLDGKTLYLTIK